MLSPMDEIWSTLTQEKGLILNITDERIYIMWPDGDIYRYHPQPVYNAIQRGGWFILLDYVKRLEGVI